jgi:hypothetical protein
MTANVSSFDMMRFAMWLQSAAAQLEVNDQEAVARAYSSLVSSHAGRVIMADLMLSEGLLQPSFVPGISMDAPTASYRDGRKSVVADIFERAVAHGALSQFLNPQPEENNNGWTDE